MECAADDAEDFLPIAAVMRNDDGTELDIIQADVGVAAPLSLAGALRNLAP